MNKRQRKKNKKRFYSLFDFPYLQDLINEGVNSKIVLSKKNKNLSEEELKEIEERVKNNPIHKAIRAQIEKTEQDLFFNSLLKRKSESK